MSDPTLLPGDKVVDLAGLLRSSAVQTGAVASAVSLWMLKHGVLWTVGALVLGGVAGFVLGALIGPLLFPARAGDIMVVKLGPGALGLALKAGLIGGLCAGILAGLAPPLILSQPPKLAHGVGIGVLSGILLGSLSAYIATRP